MSIITIDNLATAKFEAGKSYKLAPKTHTLTGPAKPMDRCTIDCEGATIVYDKADGNQLWFVYKKQQVRIYGGSYLLGPTNYVAFLEHGAHLSLIGAKILGCPQPNKMPGGLAILRGAVNAVVQDCEADTVNKYFLFLESDCVGVTIDHCTLKNGSLDEAGIRIRDCSTVLISNCDITAKKLRNKDSAVRMQDGEHFKVIGGRFNGGFGAGPLADGDGGRNETDPAKRADKINKRMQRVSVIGAQINGYVTCEAGLEDFEMIGGSITASKVFQGTTWRYPEKPEWTKPEDAIRPQAHGSMVNVKITGDIADNPIDLIDCVTNGTRQTVPAVKK